jgi:hypothetical protein
VLKRLASILLLSLLLFNWIGFRLLYNVIEHHANTELASKIDRFEFDEQQLVTIKVPLNLPYQQNWAEFERYDGDVSVDGVQYKYVMRKVYNDSLILKCIPNESKKRIDKAAHNYYQLVNDLQHKGNQPEKSRLPFFKSLLTEFWDCQNTYTLATVSNVPTVSPIREAAHISVGYLQANDRPPQA